MVLPVSVLCPSDPNKAERTFLCAANGSVMLADTRNLRILDFNQIQKFKGDYKMAVNFGHEYLKFEKEQKKLRKEYLAAGMTEAEADEMYDFDKKQFDRDLAFYRRIISLDFVNDDFEQEARNPLLESNMNTLCVEPHISVSGKYGWLEEIENESLVRAIRKLKLYEIETIDLLINGMTQEEAAAFLEIDQSTISYRIKRIREKIKKYGFHS